MILSPQNKAVLVPNSTDLDLLYPTAESMIHKNMRYKVLKHDVPTTGVLRRLGFTVPSPMLEYYNFGDDVTPFHAQRVTCDLLSQNERAYVLNDMGTGKTKAALWAWDYLNTEGLAGKALVVAPLTSLRFTWAHEAFATLPHRKAVVLHGTAAQRRALLEQPADIYIINHDGYRVLKDNLLLREDIDTLILDELAVYRNGGTDRTRQIRAFARRKKWVWGMTGSPMPNRPTDAWAQATILTPDRVPRYFSHARDDLMIRKSEYEWDPKPDAVQRAYSYMQPAVRFTLEEVAELPDAVYQDIEVALEPAQAEVYLRVAKEFISLYNDKKITAQNSGAAMNKLLQISGGWVYDEEKAVVPLPNDGRMAALRTALEGTPRKSIVFAPFIHTVEGISAYLEQWGMDYATVYGETSHRETIFNGFQFQDSPHVIAAHPRCMSHSLTLTAGDTVVWFLPTSSLETYEQANARIRRVGQKHKQYILHLVSTPVEKKLYKLLKTKQATQEAFLALFENNEILDI